MNNSPTSGGAVYNNPANDGPVNGRPVNSGPSPMNGGWPADHERSAQWSNSAQWSDSAQWYDEDAGPLVRLYALTRGRARADDQIFNLMTLVTAQSGPYDDPTLSPEQARVLALCRHVPQPVAEIASRCDLPLGVTRVLLGDLLEIGHIRVRQPAAPADVFDERILQEVIDGLRAL